MAKRTPKPEFDEIRFTEAFKAFSNAIEAFTTPNQELLAQFVILKTLAASGAHDASSSVPKEVLGAVCDFASTVQNQARLLKLLFRGLIKPVLEKGELAWLSTEEGLREAEKST